jgi:transcriptional regulator with XRE-family HTH domain
MLQLGMRVTELRHTRFTQEQLAERVGMSSRQLQRIEAGEVDVSLSTLVVLARALAVEPGALLQAPTSRVVRRVGRPPIK